MVDTHDPIVVAQEFAAASSAVWDAITDPERMRGWYFDTIGAFRPEPGFEARFNVHCEGTDYEHVWLVREVIPGERLVHGWRYEGIPGEAEVRWELAETPAGTRLTFTEEFLEPFPDDPLFTREVAEEGWDYFVRGTLKAYVEEGQVANGLE